MRENKEILRERVITAFNEYKDYVELSTKQNSDKKNNLEKLKENYKVDENASEVQDFAFEIFMIDAYHRRDITILGTKFVNYFRLFKEIPDVEPFDKDIEDTYEYLKERQIEQAFVVEKGKFEEINKGFIEERKKVFEEKNIFNEVKSELEKYLK